MNKMSSGLGPISPSSFKVALASRYRQYAGNQQHDAHEFLMLMLEQLSEEVANSFCGSLISTISCTGCASRSEKVETFSCISVEIAVSSNSSVSLKDGHAISVMQQMELQKRRLL